MRTPTQTRIDGIRLDGYRTGCAYEVGTALAAVFLAEGWAVPAPDNEPALPMAVAELEAEVAGPPNLIWDDSPPGLKKEGS